MRRPAWRGRGRDWGRAAARVGHHEAPAEVAAAVGLAFRPGRLREQAGAAAGRGARRLNLARVPAGGMLRMVVPGWAQWYLGNAARGRNYFVPWLMLVLIGVANWGSLLGSVALYAALCVHGTSIADVLCRPARRMK